MIRERIADDIYVFTSERYARVTCGAILTKEGVVLIDTLFYPDETKAVKNFLENRLGQTVRYIINTHYHADHTMGNCLFPSAQVIGHARCYDLLNTVGRAGVEQMRTQTSEFENVEVILPHLILEEGTMTLHIGGKRLLLQHRPGHSPDLTQVFLLKERILFASDNVMPVPTIFDGKMDDLVESLDQIRQLQPDCVVRGHGEVILRGEVNRVLQDDVDYLLTIRQKVESLIVANRPESELELISIESCGKSRIPLNGLVADLHLANLRQLHTDLLGKNTHGHAS